MGVVSMPVSQKRVTVMGEASMLESQKRRTALGEMILCGYTEELLTRSLR